MVLVVFSSWSCISSFRIKCFITYICLSLRSFLLLIVQNFRFSVSLLLHVLISPRSYFTFSVSPSFFIPLSATLVELCVGISFRWSFDFLSHFFSSKSAGCLVFSKKCLLPARFWTNSIDVTVNFCSLG